ncbi:4a-hydroxytetrahydrobiopterin dehydratase [Propionivibrio sp.]|uniref:4a-hydroxytetrahydrobiopterin dehydratase n=1 Tax=Propionivibrio sp. TaxID=2212460 RepID=UPI0025FB269A|nr:4a-hydroxytetrahydrobiopterin dehydratase [Propionivibrio sp.]MBK8745309.1 4a-hydroxytetrahydrobiopterin dehydratase [Propionivibrio sp.]
MNISKCDLAAKRCKPCERGIPPLDRQEIDRLLKGIGGWELSGVELIKTFQFKNYYETMAFVNATAWVSHREDHHPDLEVGYKQCRVRYTTHAIGGLSENDFICAAKIDALILPLGS